jgi:hypothetical protein
MSYITDNELLVEVTLVGDCISTGLHSLQLVWLLVALWNW